jgi:hypothetical protein
MIDTYYPATDGERFLVDKDITGDQPAQYRFMVGENFKDPGLPGKNHAAGFSLKNLFLWTKNNNFQHFGSGFT